MKNQFKRLTLTLMLPTLLFALSACSSKQPEEDNIASTSPIESSTETIVEKPESTALMKTTIEPETETSIIAETSEEAPEAIIYEGIDMESDLPGLKWIETFKNIIDEPKLVVFNDSTNKKMIIENDTEVDFAPDDTLAIYAPETMEIEQIDIDNFNNFVFSNYPTMNEVSKRYDIGDSFVTKNIIIFNGEKIELTATINLR